MSQLFCPLDDKVLTDFEADEEVLTVLTVFAFVACMPHHVDFMAYTSVPVSTTAVAVGMGQSL